MQTNIEQFIKIRKRPATDELPGQPTKMVARKLFDCVNPSSPSQVTNTQESMRLLAKPSTPSQPSSTEESKEPARPSTPTTLSTEESSCQTPEPGPSTPCQSPSTQELLRKKHNLGEFRKRIRQNKKYTLFKKKLEQCNSTISRLKPIEESSVQRSPELRKFENVEIEIPSSPVKCGTLKPRRLFWTSPIRSPAKDLAYVSPKKLLNEGPKQVTPVKAVAFERYNHLLAAGKDALILPHKYLVLKEVFRSVDIVTKIKNDNKEKVTFTKLRKDVQKMLERNFTEAHLGKIKAVYPEAYEFSRERVKVPFSNEVTYELMIKRLPHSMKKEDCSEPVELSNVERLKIFHNRLLDETKIHHQEFLSKLDPPITLDSNKLKLWHADFPLDNVPDIEPAPLPEPPTDPNNTSAKAILEKSSDLISLNNRMARAVAAMPEHKPKEVVKKENTTPSTPSVLPAYQKALLGVPKALLEKIRAKQAAKIAETLTQTPAEAKEAIMLSRLPELARIMRNVFVTEKKCVLPVEIVLQKISHSYKEKLSSNDMMQHMKLIAKHVPGWMNFFTISNISYIRLSKDADMTRVLGKLQKLANPA